MMNELWVGEWKERVGYFGYRGRRQQICRKREVQVRFGFGDQVIVVLVWVLKGIYKLWYKQDIFFWNVNFV